MSYTTQAKSYCKQQHNGNHIVSLNTKEILLQAMAQRKSYCELRRKGNLIVSFTAEMKSDSEKHEENHTVSLNRQEILL